jgi:hypothetical protein
MRRLLWPYLQTPVSALSHGLRGKVRLLLQHEVDNAALCGVQEAEREWHTILSYMFRCKSRHRVQLGLSGLAKPFSVNYEAVISVQ